MGTCSFYDEGQSISFEYGKEGDAASASGHRSERSGPCISAQIIPHSGLGGPVRELGHQGCFKDR